MSSIKVLPTPTPLANTAVPLAYMSQTIVEDPNHPEKEVVIAVMGATGTGKSTFINLVSGGKLGVGNGLRSCTSDVAYSDAFNLGGRHVILIDTPGFDDTMRSDTDILKTIALHLSTTYQAGVQLSGIIYMHRISDVRVGGINRRNIKMFRKLCGEGVLPNALVVTTMWGKESLETCEMREKELMEDDMLFKPILDGGARMVRHDNTLQTARELLLPLIRNHPEPLGIQRELVDENKDISETSAGEELAREFADIMKKHRENLEDVRKEMAVAQAEKDEKTIQELHEERRQIEGNMERVKHDRERLSREYAEEMKKIKEEIQRLGEVNERPRGYGAVFWDLLRKLRRPVYNMFQEAGRILCAGD